MKHILTIFLVFLIGSVGLAESQKAKPEIQKVKVTINGMVCSFCANKVKSNFKKKAQNVVVHLDQNLDDKINDSYVEFELSPGSSISDDEIKKTIIKSGFDVVEIKRSK